MRFLSQADSLLWNITHMLQKKYQKEKNTDTLNIKQIQLDYFCK